MTMIMIASGIVGGTLLVTAVSAWWFWVGLRVGQGKPIIPPKPYKAKSARVVRNEGEEVDELMGGHI